MWDCQVCHMREIGVRRMKRLATLLFAAVQFACATTAFAAGYPDRPIKIVSPFPPGGTTDLISRAVAGRLTEHLGVSVVVENKAGGSGIPGTDAVARAAPDGYTLLMAGSPHGINNSLLKSVPYDPVTDFVPVSLIVNLPLVLVVRPELPIRNLEEFTAYGKANPESLKCGMTPGAASDLAAKLFRTQSGVPLTQVAYRGDAPAITDLLAGHIDCLIVIVNQALPHIKSGKFRPIATTGRSRLDALPDIPTMQERGLKQYEAASWNGIFAPAGTPPEIVKRLSEALNLVTQEPEFRNRWIGIGALVHGNGPAELRDHLSTEIARWAAVIEAAGLREK